MTERLAVFGATMLAILAGGCGDMPSGARSLLTDAYAAYNTGDHEQAIESSTAFLDRYRRLPQAPEAYLIRGLGRFEAGQFDRAELDLQSVLDRTAQRPLRAKALMTLGEIAYKRDQLEIAEMRFETCLNEIPRGQPPADQVHWRLGRIQLAQGRFEQADVHFDHILELFPESQVAPGARQLLGAKAWTVHVGLFETIESADARVQRLTEAHLPARRQAYVENDKLYYAVLVGRHATQDGAKATLQRVRKIEPEAYTTIDKTGS
jgi:tetratricopeptide (TPR) repeat protein